MSKIPVNIIDILNRAEGMNHIFIVCVDNEGTETRVKVTDVIKLLNSQKTEIKRLERILNSWKEVPQTEMIKEYTYFLTDKAEEPGFNIFDIVDYMYEFLNEKLKGEQNDK